MPLNQSAKRAWGPETLRPANDFTLPIPPPGAHFPGGAQIADLHLNLTIAGYMQPADVTDPTKGEEYYVVVDLGQSTFSPGTMIKDDSANRGFYTHAVDVKMTFDADVPSSGSAGQLHISPKHTSPYVLDASTPESSAATGGSSSSSSTSATLGFFGTQLTASGSVSTSDSGSRAYADYEVLSKPSHSPAAELSEQYMVFRLSDGGGYHVPADLIDNHYDLSTLPPRATSALDITSAASFLAAEVQPKVVPAPAVLVGRVEATVVAMFWLDLSTFAALSGMDAGIVPTLAVMGASRTKQSSFDVSRQFQGQYLGPSGAYVAVPRIVGADFACDVDFANGKVALR